MKKIITTTATLSSLAAVLLYAHDRPLLEHSTIGRFVEDSDVAGIGNIISVEDNNLVIQVDTPLYGCTNQQTVAISGFNFVTRWNRFEFVYEPPEIVEAYFAQLKAPPLTGRIVFLVSSNEYYFATDPSWNKSLEEQRVLSPYDKPHRLEFVNQNDEYTWFYPDADDGLVFTHLTNVIRVARTERNWTNYYEVCRDAVNSPSERVKNDSRNDLRELMKYASHAELLLMQNDPLFPALLGDELAKQIYLRVKYPNIKPPLSEVNGLPFY